MLNFYKNYNMTENQRFERILYYLIDNKKVRNQQQFVEEIQSDKTTVSQIKNGKLNIPNDMFAKITNAFPYISPEWLKNEKGEMLKDNTIVDFGKYSISQFKDRGYAPYYSYSKVSAGQYDLATLEQNEEPDSWVKFSDITAEGWFPIVGCSMEPKIHAGDTIGVVTMHNWERFDPDKIYMIVTIYDRMVKHLKYDESTPDILWAISDNAEKIKIFVHEILRIYRVVFVGRLV